jgi:hypothetical protein
MGSEKRADGRRIYTYINANFMGNENFQEIMEN